MHTKIKNIVISLGLVSVLVSGCSALTSDYKLPASSNTVSDGRDESGGVKGDQAQKPGIVAPTPGVPSGNITGDQKLIKNGNLTLKASNIETAQVEIDVIAKRYSGYIFSMNQSQTPDKRFLTITIKVQKDHFDDAINDLKALGQTSNVQMDVNDVTTQFIDTEARLKTLQVKETTLVSLLARATEISDIIMIEENLQQTRQQIESSQGQLNALKNATEFSTITINVTDTVGLLNTEEPQSLWSRFTENFNNGLRYWARVGVVALSGAIFLFPILIPLAILLLLIARVSRRNRKNLFIKHDPLHKSRLYSKTENPVDEHSQTDLPKDPPPGSDPNK